MFTNVGMTVILRRGFAREIMKNSHETSLLVQQWIYYSNNILSDVIYSG